MVHGFKCLAEPIKNVKNGLEYPAPSSIVYEAIVFAYVVQPFTLEQFR